MLKRFLMLVAAVSVLAAGSMAYAGAVGGPQYDVERVGAYTTTCYTISFYGDEVAVVTVEGDGDTDLDLYVYDPYGNQITSDTGWSDSCVVRFRPYWTGPFRIEVVNRGAVYNDYALVTN